MCLRQSESKVSRETGPAGQREGKSASKAKYSNFVPRLSTKRSMFSVILRIKTIGILMLSVGPSHATASPGVLSKISGILQLFSQC